MTGARRRWLALGVLCAEPARDRHRQHDRQRRAPHAGARPRRRRQRAPVGGRRVHARVRRAAARWPARWAIASGAGARCSSGSPCSAPPRRGAAYAGGVDGLIARPRGDGRRRRVHHARDALAPDQRLHRHPRARDGDRHLGRDRGPRRRARPGASAASCSTTSGGARSSSSTSRSIAIAIVAGTRLIPESRDPVARRIDWTGAALSGVGLVALVWAIIEAPSKGWTSAPVLGAGALAAVALVAFVRLAAPRRGAAARRPPVREPALHRGEQHRSWCCSSPCSGSCSCRRSTCSSSSATRRRPPGVRVLPYAGAMIVFAPLSVDARGAPRHQARRHRGHAAASRPASPSRRRSTTGSGYGRLAIALRAHGRGHGARGRAGDRVDHGLAPARRGRTSARRSTTRPASSAARSASPSSGSIMSSLYARRPARRRPGRRARVARRRRPGRRRRRRRGARGVRPRDVAGVDRRRGRGRARRGHRLALPPGPGGGATR